MARIYRQITGKGRGSIWHYRATVLAATAVVVTVIEVGNALKADIERLDLKCREVPIASFCTAEVS